MSGQFKPNNSADIQRKVGSGACVLIPCREPQERDRRESGGADAGQAVALIKVFVASDPLVAILRNLESPRCFQLLIVVTVTPSAVAACW